MFLGNIHKNLKISCVNMEEERVIDGEFNLINKKNRVFDVLADKKEYSGFILIDSKIRDFYFAYIIVDNFVFSVLLNKPILTKNLFNQIYRDSICLCTLDVDEHTPFDHLDCETSQDQEDEFFYKTPKEQHIFLKKHHQQLAIVPIKFKRNKDKIFCKYKKNKPKL